MDAGKESPAGRPPSRRRSAVRPGGPVWAALLLATAVTVTGCAGGPPPQRAPAAQPPAGTQPAGPAPRTTATATAPERSLLHRAEQELLRSCMAAAGFRFRPVPENPLPEARDFPYVVDDVRWAQRYGYGGVLRERARRLRDQDPNRVYLRQATWYDDSSNWVDRNMRNQASSVHNNGFAGAYDDVLLYWDAGHGGAAYCLRNGNYLMDMRYDRFPYNGTGGGQAMNDNISSHRWVDYCQN
jgi:hypothetical protein